MIYISIIVALFLLTNTLFGMEGWSLEVESPLRNASTQRLHEFRERPVEEYDVHKKADPSKIFIINLVSTNETIIQSCLINTKNFPTDFKVLNTMVADCDEPFNNKEINLSESFISKNSFEKLFQDNKLKECLTLYENNKKIQQQNIISLLNDFTDNHLMEILTAANYLNCISLVKACVKIIGKKTKDIADCDDSINYLKKISCYDISNAVAKKILKHSLDIKSFLIPTTELQKKELINTQNSHLLDISPNGNWLLV